MAELVGLKLTRSVQKFLDQFDRLLNQVELSEEYSINCLLQGLKLEFEVQVRMLAPRTLTKAYSLAKLAEHSLNLQREQSQVIMRNSRSLRPTPTFWSFNYRNYLESSKGAVGSKSFSNNRPTLKGSRRLKRAVMDEKMEKRAMYL